MVKYLVENFPDMVKENCKHGKNALIASVRQEGFNVVRFLLKNTKIEVNHQNSEGLTAINKASLYSLLKIVEILLEHGADIKIPDNQGRTPLYNAIQSKEYKDSYKVVKLLIDNGADVNKKCTDGMYTSLMKAVYMNRMDLVELLLENGADIEARTKYNANCFFIAAENGYLEILKYLVKKNIDINIKLSPPCYKTPLDAAIFRKKLIEYELKDSKWSVNQRLRKNEALKNYKVIIKYLIDLGVKTSEKTKTPDKPKPAPEPEPKE